MESVSVFEENQGIIDQKCLGRLKRLESFYVKNVHKFFLKFLKILLRILQNLGTFQVKYIEILWKIYKKI